MKKKNITAKDVLNAAVVAAREFGFEDGECAFWQCNLFSNAVVKAARLYDIWDITLNLVEAKWVTPSGDVEAGDVHKHVLIFYNGVYIDYTIRQINEKAKFPFTSVKLPKYAVQDYGEIDIEELENEDKKYIDAIVKAIDPTVIVKVSNPTRKKFPKLKKATEADLKSAFHEFWNSPIVQKKGSLLRMGLEELWALEPKTLHQGNLSNNSKDPEFAKTIKRWMRNPIIIVLYKHPDPEMLEAQPERIAEIKKLWDEEKATAYILDGSHRYNEANTINEYRLNPEEDYATLPVFILDLEEKDRNLDVEFFDWLTEVRIPNGNWS